MNYKNTEVALTVKLRGAQALRGAYNFNQKGLAFEKDVNGNIHKFPIGTLETAKPRTFHECTLTVTLKNDFVNWAITDEARPKKELSARDWAKKGSEARLNYHIRKYVDDLYGDTKFDFEILEG